MTNPEAMRSMMEMRRMMGNSPFGGAGGQEAFAMPGATTTTDAQHQNQAQGQNQQQQGQQPNPFASMLGGAGGVNPLMFMPPPPAGGDRSADPNANQANPFAALFNPAMFGQPQGQAQGQQTGQTETNTPNINAGSDSTNPTSPPPNPFASNPFLANMMNNPMVQQMMNNPEAMRQAMQMIGAQGGGGALGGIDPFAALGGGGFGQPADNRPPEERFATQLRQLNEMGFYNFDQNIQALSRSGGDVNGALEWLFSQPPS